MDGGETWQGMQFDPLNLANPTAVTARGRAGERGGGASLTANLACLNFLGSTSHAFWVPGLTMSYAIIRTGGKQFRVEPGKKYRIPSIVGEAGGSIEFNDVLLGS